MNDKPLPLFGLKVIEMGTLIAGPFAGKLLAEFGAEVIKIEPPNGGDPLRTWRKLHKETSLWWYLQARNKKSVTVNLKSEEGQEIVRRLAGSADILIENFRPGTMEKWNLGWDQLSAANPRLIMVRVSGYGQSGPYRDRTGFGAVGESMGGLRYVTGHPDRPPARVGISLGIHGDGRDPHAPGSLDDAAGDLAAIGDQDLLEHGRSTSLPEIRSCRGIGWSAPGQGGKLAEFGGSSQDWMTGFRLLRHRPLPASRLCTGPRRHQRNCESSSMGHLISMRVSLTNL